MGGIGSDFDEGSSGEIIFVMKAIVLLHFDIDSVRIVHVDMAESRSGG